MKTNEILMDLFKKSGLTRKEFCYLADISVTNFRNCKNLKNEVRFSAIERICIQLGYDVEIKITPK